MKKSEKILPLVIVISLLFSGIPVCASSIWYSIYFTPEDKCDQKMVDLINSANSSIYAALYDIKLENVADALIDAYRNRSIDVKIVMDNERANVTGSMYSELSKRGIVKTDFNLNDYMHNKFMVIDNKTVWTGSMNPTPNGAYCNNNSVIVINSTELSCDYVAEFVEMWNGMFGAGSPADTPYPIVYVNGTEIECYFAPEDGVEAQIIDELKSANHSVYFATFTFTCKPIAQTLIDLHEKGVEVKGIYEHRQNSTYCTFQMLHDAGIEVIWDKNPKAMHHKFFVIDNATTITGSYNPTKHANTANDENVLIIYNKSISDAYVGEFDKMWNEWQPAPPEKTLNLYITEVFYDTPGKDSEEEWIELYNPTTADLDISGLILRDNSGKWKLPSGTVINANSTIIVAKDRDGFLGLGYDLPSNVSGMSLALSNTGDVLKLMNGDTIIDMVAWENYIEDWNIVADTNESIQRTSSTDTDTVEDWSGHMTPNPWITIPVEPKKIVFDTGAGTYPSIFGMHNGTLTPNQMISVHKLYTYPCKGTGGHTEYVKIWNLTWNVTANWNGYRGDWHNVSFNESFTLVKDETYNYTIRTGSYPQIHHTPARPTANGWINCTEFRDANGKIYYDWIPAIKLYF